MTSEADLSRLSQEELKDRWRSLPEGHLDRLRIVGLLTQQSLRDLRDEKRSGT